MLFNRRGRPLVPGRPQGEYPVASTARRLPLDAWLAVHPGTGGLGVADTVLRTMASNYGLMRGLAASCLGTAGVLVAATALAVLHDAPAAGAWLLLAAAVLAACGLGTLRGRTVRGVPSASLLAHRGAGTVRSGMTAGLVIGAVLTAVVLPVTLPMLRGGGADVVTALAVHVLVLAQALCVFAVPAWFVEHAVRDFRAAVLRDPRRYAALDRLSRTWDEPFGTREFGPL